MSRTAAIITDRQRRGIRVMTAGGYLVAKATRKTFYSDRGVLHKKPKTRKMDFIKAIEGTYGDFSQIADNLNIARPTVERLLNRVDWQDVLLIWKHERARLGDMAESNMVGMAKQNHDLPIKYRANEFILRNRKREEYGDQSKVVHEGGDKPIKSINLDIPLDALDLPIEVKRRVLEALDEKQTKGETTV